MSSIVLPQALITIPRNPNQCPTRNIRFSTFISCCSSSLNLNSSQVSNLGSSRNYFGSNFSPLPSKISKRDFVVRAEENESQVVVSENTEDDEGVGVVEASVEAEVESQEEAVLESEVNSEEAKPPRKPRVKLGDVMGILNKRAVEASEKERPVPDIRTGDIVEIKLEVPENKRRLSVYKGIVMSRQNAGIHTTIRIRRIIAGIGVEIVFPLYSPNIKELKVVKHRKVRRARLYYLRDKLPRLSTFK